MATIILNSHKAQMDNGVLGVLYDGKPGPFPSRLVPVRTTADALSALDTYKAEAGATGIPMAISMSLQRGDRAPSGYRKAIAGAFYHPVNL